MANVERLGTRAPAQAVKKIDSFFAQSHLQHFRKAELETVPKSLFGQESTNGSLGAGHRLSVNVSLVVTP